MTGLFRDGNCAITDQDIGVPAVCARGTSEFLDHSKARGNDLVTPVPAFGFPGLRPGSRWCLCAALWKKAMDPECAPPVLLGPTHEGALEVLCLDDLKRHALYLC